MKTIIKKIVTLSLALLTTFSVFSQAPDFKVDTLLHSGLPDSEAIVMTFVGDGFMIHEQDSFVGQVRDFKDYFMDVYPVTLFADKFNVYAIRVVSNVSSGTNFPPTTFFGVTRSGNFGLPSAGQRSLEQLLDRYAPESNVIVLYINSNQAAGVAHGFSGRYPSVAIQSAFNKSYLGVTTHEIGHTLGGLRDEYGYLAIPPSSGESPNATRDSNATTNRWRAFFGIDGVGMYRFENAAYPSGVLRPTDPNYALSDSLKRCIMDQTNPTWGFCKVCQAHMVRRMAALTGETFLGGDDKITHANVLRGQTRIVNYAFYGMYRLDSVNIASSVASIGSYAFLRCTSLNVMTNFAITPQVLDSTVFYGIENLSSITLRVPIGSISAYQAAPIWKDFNIIAIPDGVTEPEPIVMPPQLTISRARVNTWESQGGDTYIRDALYDDNRATFWHARWHTGSGHRGGEALVDIDLGSERTISFIELDGRFSGGNPQIREVHVLKHSETGDLFPNGQSMTGPGDYPPINANVEQSQIDADFSPNGWTSVTTESSGLNTRNVILKFEQPITTRYIRFGVTQVNTPGDPSFAQVSEIRVFGIFDGMKFIDSAKVEVNGTFTFTGGNAIEPTDVTVTLDGSELTMGTDFKILRYDRNRYVGTATVFIRGIGDYVGSASGSFIIGRATQETPNAPTLANRTHNRITLAATPGFEYRKDEEDWQLSNIFLNLFPETTYMFYQRRAESLSYFVSESSEGAEIATTAEVSTIQNRETEQALRAWMSNDILHIEGLTIGQIYRIYNIAGTLVYQGIATKNPMQIQLPNRGAYIIQSENKSVKIVY
jgi:hypothetical protein